MELAEHSRHLPQVKETKAQGWVHTHISHNLSKMTSNSKLLCSSPSHPSMAVQGHIYPLHYWGQKL